jgi:Rrf2 family protein
MHITYRGDYALKSILYLSVHYANKPVTIHEIAGHLDIPIKFLEQILLDLKRGNFVESKRGKVGGYILAKHPAQINLGEIIRYIDGPVGPIACIGEGYNGCADIYKCVFRKIWQDVNKATSDIIDNITFEDLANEVRLKDIRGAITYQI